MKVVFIKFGNKGRAVYDPDTEEYSWSYEGDEQKIIDLLSQLDSGRSYTKVVTYEQANVDGDLSNLNEGAELKTWDEHIEQLANHLSRNGCDILYVGSV